MLDVHILVSNNTRRDWVAQSLASVRDAINRADYPIDIRRIGGSIEGGKSFGPFNFRMNIGY